VFFARPHTPTHFIDDLLTCQIPLPDSESIGSSSVIGDSRWAGDYGVDADFIAVTHCSAEFIPLQEILVRACLRCATWCEPLLGAAH
jgi:hypothetical protein